MNIFYVANYYFHNEKYEYNHGEFNNITFYLELISKFKYFVFNSSNYIRNSNHLALSFKFIFGKYFNYFFDYTKFNYEIYWTNQSPIM